MLVKGATGGLPVCLSVNNITEKAWLDFHETFSIGRAWLKENGKTGKFVGCHVQTLEYWVSFALFSRKPVSVSNITAKQMNGFSWNFQQSLHMRQGTLSSGKYIWNSGTIQRLVTVLPVRIRVDKTITVTGSNTGILPHTIGTNW